MKLPPEAIKTSKQPRSSVKSPFAPRVPGGGVSCRATVLTRQIFQGLSTCCLPEHRGPTQGRMLPRPGRVWGPPPSAPFCAALRPTSAQTRSTRTCAGPGSAAFQAVPINSTPRPCYPFKADGVRLTGHLCLRTGALETSVLRFPDQSREELSLWLITSKEQRWLRSIFPYLLTFGFTDFSLFSLFLGFILFYFSFLAA